MRVKRSEYGAVQECKDLGGDPRENPPTSATVRRDSRRESNPVRLGGRRVWLDYSPSTKVNQVRFLAGSTPDFRRRLRRRTKTLLGGFSRGSPVSPPLHSGTAPYPPRFTPFGSLDRDDIVLKSSRRAVVLGSGVTSRFAAPCFSEDVAEAIESDRRRRDPCEGSRPAMSLMTHNTPPRRRVSYGNFAAIIEALFGRGEWQCLYVHFCPHLLPCGPTGNAVNEAFRRRDTAPASSPEMGTWRPPTRV
ncbi:hypothetical protein PR048_028638 [Dryococelus australis]|uniref:Uncharacterized protein n=1 Tax=Dryococelus australis TaxID=614101 RepID=A0ABQ9GB51_9NEOP|nr:hypothetical protein PR048_028638 [Dryococelus australis]